MSEEKLTEETLKAQEEEKERQRWLQVKYRVISNSPMCEQGEGAYRPIMNVL